ncbi:MAG TPA: hypothetical protein VFW57_07815, partial [Acidimicrobiia bacterium]|nr:hypothetical protein [Acidimicrobiia bacterium]
MRRVVPRAGIILLCAAVLAVAATSGGQRDAAGPDTAIGATDTTRSEPPLSQDGTITTGPLFDDVPAPPAPSAEPLPAE